MSKGYSESGALSPESLGTLDFEDDMLDPDSPLSPALGPLAMPPSASPYALPNAVHMEVQENAKLPTFNLPIDRSNSRRHSFGGGYAPATARAIDEMIRLSENDYNLSEMFLKSGERANANLAYSGAGVLLSSTGRHMGSTEGRNSFKASTASDADSFVSGSVENGGASVSASPSSQNPVQPSVPSTDTKTEGLPSSATVITAPALPSKHDMQSVYPYGRRVPLPIPTKPPSPPAVPSSTAQDSENSTGDPLAVSIATAAVIASQQDATPLHSPSLGASQSVRKHAGSPTSAPTDRSNLAMTSCPDTLSNSTVPVRAAAPVAPVLSGGANVATKPALASATSAGLAGSSTGIPTTFNNPIPTRPLSKRFQNGRGALSTEQCVEAKRLASRPATASALPTTQSSRPPTKQNFESKAQPKAGTPATTLKPTTPSITTLYSRRTASDSHPAARAAPSASIKEATKRRAQFGFGDNHVVPSVPSPPPKPRSKKATSRVIKQTQQRHIPPASAPNDSVAAYERKKQRAKDARVKLNEGIERLAMAINLAGSQSEQRATQINALDFDGASAKVDEIRQHTLQIMNDCQSTALNAKKWDRPSFVGTAATLIKEMNSQCDALLRVMMEWRKQVALQQGIGSGTDEMRETVPSAEETESALIAPASVSEENDLSTSVLQNCARINGTSGKAVFDSQHRLKHVISRDLEMEPLPAKRQRSSGPGTLTEGDAKGGASNPNLGDLQSNGLPNVISASPSLSESGTQIRADPAEEYIFHNASVMQTISSFLDPRSLSRCAAVSKDWKNLEAFQGEDRWLDCCIQRYGLVAVRRWLDSEEDDNAVESSSMSNLYRRMDKFNQRPQCHHEGNVLLGGARIPGVVGAWMSMVVRSNGETSRSVRKEGTSNNTGSIGEYTSIPVVELRLLIQNIGVSDGPILLKKQVLTVDASTRRRGEEMSEIQWDERLKMRVLNADGSSHVQVDTPDANDVVGELCRLRLFESVVLVAHIHARGCSTTSKFQRRANFARLLVTVKGTTVPLAIPFTRENDAYRLERSCEDRYVLTTNYLCSA